VPTARCRPNRELSLRGSGFFKHETNNIVFTPVLAKVNEIAFKLGVKVVF